MRKKYGLIILISSLIATGIPISIILLMSVNQQNNPIIINHSHVNLDKIPESWIDIVQDSVKVHYAHTSHGDQIIYGLNEIENLSTIYSYNAQLCALPIETGALCIFDGQSSHDYIYPEDYWNSETGIEDTYSVLDNNPSISVSMFCWCTQMDTYTTEEVNNYLVQMSAFERHYQDLERKITFVYMTGNADQEGSLGYTRYQNNQIIREFCKENNKILFDFADIECYLYDENGNAQDYSTYEHDTGDGVEMVPLRHPNYNHDDIYHTTAENCINKGKAYWALLAIIAGFNY